MNPKTELLLGDATTHAASIFPTANDADRFAMAMPDVGTWTTDVSKRPDWEGVIIAVAYSDADGNHHYSFEWTPDGQVNSLNDED